MMISQGPLDDEMTLMMIIAAALGEYMTFTVSACTE